VDRDVAGKASQLRARFGLRPADAIQAATCLVEKAKALVTNDRQLARLKPVLDVFILEDYLLPPA
jgi:predicted nucleic acid-binding protein